MEEIFYLTQEDITEAHKQGFEEFGGVTYGLDHPCVEKRAIEPQTIYWGEEQYPGLFKKAAVYLYKITISHCFADGNKRAAFISTDLFLKFNGFQFVVDQDELYNYCLTIANHETRPNLEVIEKWIQQNTRPYTLDYDELSDL
ncbi:type II toxin-antitoxin system death-on-curing family toxin [Peribacillus sp. NPDC097198]|uniref:type II toxin-antitoxin system death-on-curing family toxin n=1 Tax=Peribacillus sp. NPDC097198 TaxID=3364397 RepID=UPI00381AE29B